MSGFLVSLGINLIIAILVYFDANKFKRQGVSVIPIVWAAAALVFSILILPFYWMMSWVVWQVQIKAIQDPSMGKGKVNYKIVIRLTIFLICFIGFSLIAGCDKPFMAHFVHKKIKVGMTVGEVENILLKYQGHHSYWILLLDAETQKACGKIKPDYDQCVKSSPSVLDCFDKFDKYTHDCEHKMYKVQEFSQVVDNIASKRIDYATYEAEISVLFMGPVFLHNDFKIYFDSDGKVKSITAVRHWD